MKLCRSTKDWMEKKWKEKGCDYPLNPSEWDKNYNGTTPKDIYKEKIRKSRQLSY